MRNTAFRATFACHGQYSGKIEIRAPEEKVRRDDEMAAVTVEVPDGAFSALKPRQKGSPARCELPRRFSGITKT